MKKFEMIFYFMNKINRLKNEFFYMPLKNLNEESNIKP